MVAGIKDLQGPVNSSRLSLSVIQSLEAKKGLQSILNRSSIYSN